MLKCEWVTETQTLEWQRRTLPHNAMLCCATGKISSTPFRHCGWKFSCARFVHSALYLIQPLLCPTGLLFVSLASLALEPLFAWPCGLRAHCLITWLRDDLLPPGSALQPAFLSALAWRVDVGQKETQESSWQRPLLHWDAFLYFHFSFPPDFWSYLEKKKKKQVSRWLPTMRT